MTTTPATNPSPLFGVLTGQGEPSGMHLACGCTEAHAPCHADAHAAGVGSTQVREAPARARHAAPLVLSVPEAAELLGISRTLAYELVVRGELPSIHLGRRVVVPRAALYKMFGMSPQ